MLHQVAAAQLCRLHVRARRRWPWGASRLCVGSAVPMRAPRTRFHFGLRRTALPAQSLVEFSIVFALVLMPLTVGVVDLGRFFYYDVAVAAAAKDGASLASAGMADSTIGDSVKADVEHGAAITLTDSNIVITPSCANRTTFTWATVKVTYNFSAITPYVQALLGGGSSIPITRSVSQVMIVKCQ
jgi:hypothetical protein